MKITTKSKVKKPLPISVKIKIPGDYPWKVLGWLTQDLCEYLSSGDAELLQTIVRFRDRSALTLLAQDWGLQCIPSSNICAPELKCKYLLTSLLKKYRFPTDKELRIQTALKKFEAAESACEHYNLVGYLDLIASKEEWVACVFTYAKDFLRKLLGDVLPGHQKLTEWSRHGPGANLDTCKGQVSTFHKYDNWPYSCTVDAYRYARFAIQSDSRWFGALQDDYRERFNIPKHFPINIEEFWNRVLKIVDSDRICFVPKNAETERSITIQAAMNLYLQLGVDGFIRRRLKRYDIDLDSQLKNQRLARQGSIVDNSKSFVTLDLSAASDTMSKKLLEVLLPPAWYRYLMDLRMSQGTLNGERTIFYSKFSAMGNGYTFVLESAIFASAIFAVQKLLHGRIQPKKCAIYGDDLIVEKWIADKVVEVLALFGFTINAEKSFFKGPLRESCGTDWFHGIPIRPVFFEDAPTDVMELFTDINRVDRILSLRLGLEDSKCVSSMEKWIPERCKVFRGPLSDESFDSYRHSKTPIGKFNKGAYWRYRRLINKPRTLSTHKFLTQKLMHDLRPTIVRPQKWDRNVGKGSRFTITERNSRIVGSKYSQAYFWPDVYEELLP